MHRKISILILASLLIVANALGHTQSVELKASRYVIVPAEIMPLVIVAQPDCPLKIEDARYLIGVDNHKDAFSYQLSNKGSKPIRYFSIVRWTSFGTGGTWEAFEGGEITKKQFMPGQTIQSGGGSAYTEIIPLTDELRDKLELRGPLKVIQFLLVDKVVFSDGSTYIADSTSRALRAYLEQIDSEIK